MTVSTHLRIAAGVCVLSTGFAIAGVGGGIAVAETGADGGTTAKSAQDSGSPSPAKPPTNVADLLRKQVQNGLSGFVSTINSLPKPGLASAGQPNTAKSTFSSSPTVHGSSSTKPPVAPDPLSAANKAAADAVSAAGRALSSAAGVAGQAANDAAGATGQAANTAAGAAGQAANTAAGAAGQAVNTAALAANDVVTTAAESVAVPVTQVVTSVQGMLSSVAGAGVALGQLPSDLSDLLGVGGVPGDGTGSTRGLPDVATAPVTSTDGRSVNPVPALPGMVNLPGAIPSTAPVMPLKFTAAQASESAAAAAPPAAAAAAASDVLAMVEHMIGAVVASVSLTALLAVALPGLGALVGACAAGIRVGYRQAKAGAELPGTAISRFVGAGPVGVVRSGSQIAWRPRQTRADVRRPTAARMLRVVRSAPESAELLDHAV